MLFYDVNSTPYKGLVSKADAHALSPGFFVEAKNIRADAEVLSVRPPITLFADLPTAGATHLGSFACKLKGVDFAFYAFAVSSTRRIYSLNLSSGAWTEVTSATAYGQNTRAGSTTAAVTFMVVRDRMPVPMSNGDVGVGGATIMYDGAEEYVIACQEGQKPLLIATLDFGSIWRCWNIEETLNPLTSPGAVATEGIYFTVSGATMPTYVDSGANMVATSNGTTPDNNPRITIGNATANGDTSRFKFASAINLGDYRARQLMFVYETNYETIWENIKIEIDSDTAGSPSGNWVTIFDGTSDLRNIVAFTSNDRLFVFAPSINPTSAVPWTAAQYIRFTWIGDTRPGSGNSYTLDLHCICEGATMPGETQYAASYFNSNNRTESYPIVYTQIQGDLIGNLGGRPIPGAKLPYDKSLYFLPKLEIAKTTTAQRDIGVDTILWYTRLPGERNFYLHVNGTVNLAGTYPISTSSGGGAWAYATSGGTSGLAGFTLTANKGNYWFRGLDEWRDISIRVPVFNHRAMPRAGTCISLRNRAVVGNIKSQQATTNALSQKQGDVWFSEDNLPFRFAPFPRVEKGQFDPYAPTAITLTGQKITKFEKTTTSLTTVDSLWIFTNKNLLSVTGLDSLSLAKPVIVAPHGTVAPNSVQSYKSTMYWVDIDRQVRAIINGQIQTLSQGSVEDKLQTIDITKCCALADRDLYRLGFLTGVLTTPQQALVWDERHRFWVGVDDWSATIGVGFHQYLTIESSNSTFILASGSDGKVYKVDNLSATQDLATTSIPVSLKTPKVHAGWMGGESLWQRIRLKGCGIFCDAMAATSWTTTYASQPDAGSASGTINIGVSTTEAWRYDTPTNGVPPTVSGVACDLTLAASLTYGKKIYSIRSEISPGADGADVG